MRKQYKKFTSDEIEGFLIDLSMTVGMVKLIYATPDEDKGRKEIVEKLEEVIQNLHLKDYEK